jgi:hypothetical protein
MQCGWPWQTMVSIRRASKFAAWDHLSRKRQRISVWR